MIFPMSSNINLFNRILDITKTQKVFLATTPNGKSLDGKYAYCVMGRAVPLVQLPVPFVYGLIGSPTAENGIVLPNSRLEDALVESFVGICDTTDADNQIFLYSVKVEQFSTGTLWIVWRYGLI